MDLASLYFPMPKTNLFVKREMYVIKKVGISND